MERAREFRTSFSLFGSYAHIFWEPFDYVSIITMSQTFQIDFDLAHRLAICRPVGTLDAEVAKQLLTFLFTLEDKNPESFNRLLDLTGIDEIRLTGPEIYEFAKERRSAAAGRAPSRSTIIATHPLARGTASIYETLMEGSQIEVRVCSDASDAAKFLNVPKEIFEPVYSPV